LPTPKWCRVGGGDTGACRTFHVTKGTPKRFVAQADSGNEIARSFCGDCGTPLYVQVATRPDVVGLRVCTLDDPGWFRPDADIFVKARNPGNRSTRRCPNIQTIRPASPIRWCLANDP